MDWIRRNWPDLLIGLALVAVISGIIVTLLNGGTFNPFGQRSAATSGSATGSLSSSTTTPNVSSSTAASPASSSDTTNAAGNEDPVIAVLPPSAGETAADNVEDSLQAAGDVAENALDAAASTAAEATETLADGVDAAADATQATFDGVVSGAAEAVQDSVDAVLPAETSAPEAAAIDSSTTISPSAPADVQASTVPTAPYRISVGAFGVPENARNLAAQFRDAGYPVFTAPQGDLTIVLVGPYDSRADAERVARQIEASELANTEIYEFADTPAQAAAPTPSESPLADEATTSDVEAADVTEATEAAPTLEGVVATPATEPAAGTLQNSTSQSVPATSETGNYLQVGAYGTVDSSMPQRRLLEDLGFTVLHVEEQGLIKLLVGPYSPDDLSAAEAQLEAQGVDSFVR